VIDLAQSIETSTLAEALRRSRWIYPLVNSGHILGLALLIGAVVPMDWAVLRNHSMPALRPFAILGLVLAASCGLLLFAVQATDYVVNTWFRIKFALLAAALLNAALHLSLSRKEEALRRTTALTSLLLWPSVLICGRMVAYS
jgi:hypothetical protein